MRKKGLGWALAFAPAVVAGILALVLLVAGEHRTLWIGVALPFAVLITGLVVTAAGALVHGVVSVRRRQRLSEAAALSAAVEEGSQRERAQHRRFLARLDHELKNPIMAIRAQAAASSPTPEWRIVDDQAMKLGTLVRDLRKLSELESRALEREQLDVEELVQESVQAIGQQHPADAARFRIDATRVPWPVPPIDGDHDLLSLALDNVLSNAAKYSDAGVIEVRLREQDGDAVIEVADNGRGIPEEDLPQIFDELARASNARDVPGSGLGLALVSTVLRKHDGTVELRSKHGAGTLVTLRIPAATSGRR